MTDPRSGTIRIIIMCAVAMAASPFVVLVMS